MDDSEKTFRVRGIPLDWDRYRLVSFLEVQDDVTSPTVCSLVREVHGASLTATINFQRIPQPLQGLSSGKNWIIPLHHELDRQPASLTVDVGFLGLTTLYTPPEEDHQLDVIAIPGFGGHSFGSFKERGGSHMWLRDALRFDITNETTDRPMARVITYGYESVISNSQSMEDLKDLAAAFYNTVPSHQKMKPIILIAHSLGGLIVKQAIIMLAWSKTEDNQRLLKAIRGIAFFGVPRDGMEIGEIGSLIPMVERGPNGGFVGSLSRINSQILAMKRRDFQNALGVEGESEIVCFYETLQSPTAQTAGNGKWALTGPSAVLVTRSSATHCRPWEDDPQHIRPVARAHREMVKFGQHDVEYEKACEILKRLAHQAVKPRHRAAALSGTPFLTKSTNLPNAQFFMPYCRNPNFAGRVEILDKLKARLGSLHGLGSSVQAFPDIVSLYGLGGIGKTQVAIEYVYWLRETHPDVSVFWVHASSVEGFRQSLTTIAKEYQIPGHDNAEEDVLPLVKKWLEKQDARPWLLVLDNADDELFLRSAKTSFAQYIPTAGRGKVLATTRNRYLGFGLARQTRSNAIKIDKMNRNESMELLEKGLGKEFEVNASLKLSAVLEGFPLALVQAVHFIQEDDITMQQYLELLDEGEGRFARLLGQKLEMACREAKTPIAIARTWMLSFQQIQRQNPTAARLLYLMSMFDRKGIPKIFISRYSGVNSSELTRAIGLLKAFSLVAEEKGDSFRIHGLIRSVARKWLIQQGELIRDALEMVLREFPWCIDSKSQAVCMTYLLHARAVLQHKGDGSRSEQVARTLLLRKMGEYYIFEGRWSIAMTTLEEAMDINKRILGWEHPSTLATVLQLTNTYLAQGRFEEAIGLGRQATETSSSIFGRDHLNTLAIMSSLACLLTRSKRWEEAESFQVQVVEVLKETLMPDHPETMSSIHTLAWIYTRQARWDEAGRIQERVVEVQRKILGADHPSTLISIANLALIYRNLGRAEEADHLHTKAVDPSNTTTTTVIPAFAWEAKGYLKAKFLLHDTLKVQEASLPPIHQRSTAFLQNRLEGSWLESDYSRSALSEPHRSMSTIQEESTAPSTFNVITDHEHYPASVFLDYEGPDVEVKTEEPDDDIASLDSLPSDMERCHEAAIRHFVSIFIDDTELSEMYHEANQKIDKTRFVENHQQLLIQLYRDFQSEPFATPSQGLAIDSLRFRSCRVRISQEISSFVWPSSISQREKVNAVLEEDGENDVLLDQFLGGAKDNTARPTPIMPVLLRLDEPESPNELSEESDDDDESLLLYRKPFVIYKQNMRHLLNQASNEVRMPDRIGFSWKFWLQNRISPPPAGFQRISYLCGCGENSYVDARELVPGGLESFRQRLLRRAHSVRTHAQNGSSSNLPSPPAPAYMGSIMSEPYLQENRAQPSTTQPETPTPAVRRHVESTDVDHTTAPQYLLLCINTKASTALANIDVGSLTNDQYLFDAIRCEYERVRGGHEWSISLSPPSWVCNTVQRISTRLPGPVIPDGWSIILSKACKISKSLYLHKISSGDFVQFHMLPIREEHCPGWFKRRQFPPEAEVYERRYLYDPVPMDVEVANIPLPHLLRPGPHLDDFWLKTFPKKLRERLIRQSGNHGQRVVGWGIHINEEINMLYVLWLLVMLLVVVGISVLIYALVTSDNASAFGLGAYLVALITVYVTYQYVAWKQE